MAKAKLTISVKRRLANGDEVFIAPGLEMECSADALEAAQSDVTDRVNAWMDALLEAYPDADPMDEDEEAEDEDEDEGDEGDEGDDEDEEGDDPTEAEIKKMKKPELLELAEAYEIELEAKTVAKMRDELIEALFSDEDEDEDEDEDDAEDGDEDDGEEEGLWTEEELDALKLSELQEIVESWELEGPTVKKGTKLAAKKAAYIEYILEAQDEEEE